MTASDLPPLSKEELAAEAGSALPDKEVMSLLDLNADLNLALDVAAPVDLAVGANANVAAPINAAVGANILSVGSADAALAHQDVNIDQGLTGYARSPTPRSTAASTRPRPRPGRRRRRRLTPPATAGATATAPSPSSALSGDLLNVDVNARRGRQARRSDRRRGRGERQRRRPDRRLRVGQRRFRRLRRDRHRRPDGSITQHLDGTAQATADQTSQINQ